MSKKIAILLLTALLTMPAWAAKKSKKADKAETVKTVELTTAEDSASYALGITMGQQVKENLSKEGYRLDLFYEAFSLSLSGEKGLFTKDSADIFLDAYQKKLYRLAIDSLRRDQIAFLEENAKQEGVITTESGLQYRVVKMGQGLKPGPHSVVKVNYTGSLITGRVFDTQTNPDKPVVLQLDRVIQGWSEGLQLMPVGSKFTFYIPQELGYGERGAGNVIPPYATLIFEVELLGIE